MSVYNRSGSSVRIQTRTQQGSGKGRRATILVAAAISAVGTRHALGATGTWNAGSGVWAVPGNWLSSVVPGVNNGTTVSTDTAYFNQLATGPTITVDANRNIGTITFDNTNSQSGVFSLDTVGASSPLLLSSGGTIDNTATVSATQNINAPLVIEGSNGNFSFSSNAGGLNGPETTVGLKFTGQISGGAAGNTTLTLDGVNAEAATSAINQISGPIVDGSSTHLSLVVNMNPTGTQFSTDNNGSWVLGSSVSTPASTYSGTTTIDNGTLEILSPSGLSPNTDITINPSTQSGGNANPELLDEDTSSTVVAHSITIKGANTTGLYGGELNILSTPNTVSLEVTAETNPGILIFTGTTTTSTVALPTITDGGSGTKNGGTFYLGGNGPVGTGGFTYINNSGITSGPVSSTNVNLDVGSVTRTIYVGKSDLPNSVAPSTDIQIRNIADTQYNGFINSLTPSAGPLYTPGNYSAIGFIKSGSGSLKINNITASYADATIEIQQGVLKLIGGSSGGGSNSFIYGPTVPIILNGSTAELNINSTSTQIDNATFGAITATAGVISTADAPSRLFAPSFNFNVASGSALSVTASLGDNNDASSLATSATFTGLIPTPTISAVTSTGSGSITFSGTDNTYTGGTTVSNGGTLLANANASGINPFSTGAIALNGSTLSFAPSASAGSGTSISYAAVNGTAGTQLTYGGGTTITLKAGNETSLAVTLGNASPSGSVLNRINNGTIVLGYDGSNLGTTEQLFVNGTAPAQTNGIVSTAIVGQTGSNADFLTYGASGFVPTTSYNTGLASGSMALLTPSTNNVVFKADGTGNTLGANGAAYAVNDAGQALSLGSNTLTVGNGSGQAGVILNGGSISGGTLAFGAAEGTIYTSSTGASISSNITGTNGLTTFGSGTLSLGGSNLTSLSGGLNINQGVLDVTADGNLGSTSNGIVFGGGTLQFGAAFNPLSSHAITLNAGGGTIDTQANNVTIASAITDGGSGGQFNKAGSGTLTLVGTNVYSGLTNISAGVLQIGNGLGGGTLGTGNVTDNGGLVFNVLASPTVAGTITGSGSFSQAGGGTVTLTGNNTVAGPVTVSSGVLKVGNVNALGYGGIIPMDTALPQATISGTGTIDLNGNVISKPITLSGGTLTNTGATTAGLSTGIAGYTVTSNNGGAGTGSGNGISSGAAEVMVPTPGGDSPTTYGATVDTVLGLTPGTIPSTFAGVTLVVGGSGYTSAPSITISGGGGTGATAHAVLSGSSIGSIVIDNPGTGYLTSPSFGLSGGGGSGASVVGYAGNFTVVGTQALTPGTGYGTGAVNTPSVDVLTGSGSAITPVLSSVSVSASSTITEAGSAMSIPVAVTGTAGSGTPVLTLSGSSANDSIGGPITGTLAITKSGSSTWTFTGTNTYSGITTINGAGALQIGNGGTTGSLGTAGVSDNASLIFNLSSSPTVSNSISGTGSVTQAGTGTVTLSGANSYGATKVNTGGLIIAPTSTPNAVALGTGAVSIGATGTLELADNASISSPFVNSSTDISNGLMNMSSLSIASGGVLDVRNNHFYVADPGGNPGDSTFASILGYVANGANSTPGGVITSSEGLPGYGVGIVDGNDGVLGTNVSANQIEVAYTLQGDANLDGKVDITDFNIFAPQFGLPTTLGWEAGDFDYSGVVDIGDFNLFAGNFGLSDNGTAISMPAADTAALDAFAAANGLTLTSVPEPASLGLLALSTVGILARRRRRTSI